MFVARGKEDALVTKNMVPGEAVYGEKRISVEVRKKCSVLKIMNNRDNLEINFLFFVEPDGLSAQWVKHWPTDPPVMSSSTT